MWWRQESSPEIEAALARVRIFATLGRRDLEKLSSACLLRHYRAGESILEEGSTGLGMFLITSGRVEVFKTLDGRKVELAVLGGGAVLGEIALLDDQPRSASAVALEDSECLLLSRERFRTLLKRRPRIAWPIVPSLARRVRDLQEQLLEAEFRASALAPVADPPVADPADSTRSSPAPKVTLDFPPVEMMGVTETRREASAPEARGAHGLETGSRSDTDVLRAPYAMIMTGAVGFGESVRLCEVFCRSLDESSGLAGGQPMSTVMRNLPASFAAASKRSWNQGRRLPSKLLETFRGHLRSDWRDEDPS